MTMEHELPAKRFQREHLKMQRAINRGEILIYAGCLEEISRLVTQAREEPDEGVPDPD